MTAWGTTTIGTVCSIYSGGTPSTAHPEYYGGDIPWIVSADLNQGHIKSVHGRITRLGLVRSSAKLVKPGTPLIALYGATAGVAAITHISGAINQAVLAVIPRDIEAEYLYQWFMANRDAVIDQYTQGGQPNLSGAIIRNIQIPLPSTAEQRKIIDALGDTDDLIATLERLIVKKQVIKQGMMQQLLTGQVRLPGFTEPWRPTLLGNHVTYIKTVALSRAQLDESSPLRYLHYGDIHTCADAHLDTVTESMPRVPHTLADRAGRLQPGDLVFADASEDLVGVGKSVEINAVPSEGVVPGLHTIAARFDKTVLADGFKAYLQFIPGFRKKLLRLATGTKVVATTRLSISSVMLPLPAVEEQEAIAEILIDADREIASLHGRATKAKALKQGMMQELLTGRTRLPVIKAAA